jgi:hypothetical protein
LDDLCLAAEVHAALVEDYQTVDLSGKNGKISIHVKLDPDADAMTQERHCEDIRARAERISGAGTVNVRVDPVAQLAD